jgi:hypothetical protein
MITNTIIQMPRLAAYIQSAKRLRYRTTFRQRRSLRNATPHHSVRLVKLPHQTSLPGNWIRRTQITISHVRSPSLVPMKPAAPRRLVIAAMDQKLVVQTLVTIPHRMMSAGATAMLLRNADAMHFPWARNAHSMSVAVPSVSVA